MKKQTKNTLKVLSTLALAGTVTLATAGKVDAKTYKPEVRYDNGKYFVKTSDPSAKGKLIAFSVKKPNSDEFLRITDEVKYNNTEVAINKGYDEMYEGEIGDNTLVAIQDEEKRPSGSEDAIEDDATLKKYKQDEKAFYEEAKNGGVTLGTALGSKTPDVDKGKVETPQPTKPVETPVKPKEEKKETPTTPKTTTPTETPKTTQTPTTPEKKVTDNKETPTPKATQAQEKTTDNKQVAEKKETTAKPLPKTTAETFGGLALYTFGGLSLLSILAFFGLRKKQK
jgi:myb-like protein V